MCQMFKIGGAILAAKLDAEWHLLQRATVKPCHSHRGQASGRGLHLECHLLLGAQLRAL